MRICFLAFTDFLKMLCIVYYCYSVVIFCLDVIGLGLFCSQMLIFVCDLYGLGLLGLSGQYLSPKMLI